MTSNERSVHNRLFLDVDINLCCDYWSVLFNWKHFQHLELLGDRRQCHRDLACTCTKRDWGVGCPTGLQCSLHARVS
ncbi:hypothetical protein BgiMline_013040, partial [Biomphalaria glabrata]